MGVEPASTVRLTSFRLDPKYWAIITNTPVLCDVILNVNSIDLPISNSPAESTTTPLIRTNGHNKERFRDRKQAENMITDDR